MKKILLLFFTALSILCSCDQQPAWKFDSAKYEVKHVYINEENGDTLSVFRDSLAPFYGDIGLAINDSIVLKAQFSEIRREGDVLIAQEFLNKVTNSPYRFIEDIYSLSGERLNDDNNSQICTFNEGRYFVGYKVKLFNDSATCLMNVYDAKGKRIFRSDISSRDVEIERDILLYRNDFSWHQAIDLSDGCNQIAISFDDTLKVLNTKTLALLNRTKIGNRFSYEVIFKKNGKWEDIWGIHEIIEIGDNHVIYKDLLKKKYRVNL